jgi:nucleoside-diphosphate-sugar epimerase
MRVAVTGASGFTGTHLVRELVRRGHTVRALVRGSSDLSEIEAYVEKSMVCDLASADSIAAALEGAEALINVVTLGTGLAPSLIEAAEQTGVRRCVFTSTTGIFTTLNPASKAIRLDAERAIEGSALDYTILRPTMIYGTPRDRNMWRLIRWLHRWPMVPVAGAGTHKQQPVHVDDLAWALSEVLTAPPTIRKAYNVSGGSVITFNEVVDTIAKHLGKRIGKVRVPLRPVYASIRAVEKLGIGAPVKSEQLLRLNEDKAFPHDDAGRDFGYAPRTFDQGIGSEVTFLRRNR